MRRGNRTSALRASLDDFYEEMRAVAQEAEDWARHLYDDSYYEFLFSEDPDEDLPWSARIAADALHHLHLKGNQEPEVVDWHALSLEKKLSILEMVEGYYQHQIRVWCAFHIILNRKCQHCGAVTAVPQHVVEGLPLDFLIKAFEEITRSLVSINATEWVDIMFGSFERLAAWDDQWSASMWMGITPEDVCTHKVQDAQWWLYCIH